MTDRNTFAGLSIVAMSLTSATTLFSAQPKISGAGDGWEEHEPKSALNKSSIIPLGLAQLASAYDRRAVAMSAFSLATLILGGF